jgi:hypothetical protein
MSDGLWGPTDRASLFKIVTNEVSWASEHRYLTKHQQDGPCRKASPR